MLIRYLDIDNNRTKVHQMDWDGAGHLAGFPGQTGTYSEALTIEGRFFQVHGLHWVLSDPETNLPVPYVNVLVRATAVNPFDPITRYIGQLSEEG
jgi:hypothetical protein